MKLRRILYYMLPPIFGLLYRKFRGKQCDALFDGDDVLFKRLLNSTQVYGEYGCGASTGWVLANTDIQVISVDTSDAWVNSVKAKNHAHESRLNIEHVDVGTLGDWGRPLGFDKSFNFQKYTDFLWSQKEAPDLVLIDGRFRVCCFLTALKFAKEGTRLIFDDYIGREHYYVVEKYVGVAEKFGRQCLFVVPSKDQIEMVELEKDIERFRYVID